MQFPRIAGVIPSPENEAGGASNAAEEACDDGCGRSVLGAARPDHQYEARAAQLADKLDWEWLDGEIAPLYSDKGRPGIASRFLIGGAWQRGAAHEGPQAGHGRHHCAAQGGQLPDRRQLFHAAIKGLTHLTHMHGVRLRQSDEAGTKQGRPCGVPASLKEPGTAAPPILNKVSMPS